MKHRKSVEAVSSRRQVHGRIHVQLIPSTLCSLLAVRSLTQVLESQLDEHNIDVSVCAQRAVCQYLQHNAAQSSLSSSARILNVLAK